jgi:hypothetical protein
MAMTRATGSNALLVQAPRAVAGETTLTQNTLSHRLLRHVLLAVVLLAALLVAIVGSSTEQQGTFAPVQVSAVSHGSGAPAGPASSAATLR